MGIAELAPRRTLASIGVLLVLGSVFLAALLWREPTAPTGQRTEADMRTLDVQWAPPPPPEAEPAPPNMQSPPPAEPVRLPRIEAPPTPRVAAPPNVSPTAAPGVAFNYRYAFRLPGQRISEIQERHARACEQLGISRCRIIGMRYRVVNERDVEAMLAFKLAPVLARRFGQAGTELVARAEGMLFDSEISGTDVGTTIRATGRNIAEMSEDLERLEARLRRPGISAGERQQIEDEAQMLRQTIRAARADQQAQQESLATTPVVFQYASGDLVPTYDTRPSIARSAARAWDNFLQGVSMIVIILVTLAPWVALALIAWWLSRPLRRRLWLATEPGATRAAAPAVS